MDNAPSADLHSRDCPSSPSPRLTRGAALRCAVLCAGLPFAAVRTTAATVPPYLGIFTRTTATHCGLASPRSLFLLLHAPAAPPPAAGHRWDECEHRSGSTNASLSFCPSASPSRLLSPLSPPLPLSHHVKSGEGGALESSALPSCHFCLQRQEFLTRTCLTIRDAVLLLHELGWPPPIARPSGELLFVHAQDGPRRTLVRCAAATSLRQTPTRQLCPDPETHRPLLLLGPGQTADLVHFALLRRVHWLPADASGRRRIPKMLFRGGGVSRDHLSHCLPSRLLSRYSMCRSVQTSYYRRPPLLLVKT